MPLQFTTDCGSETTQAFGFGNALRFVLSYLAYFHSDLPNFRNAFHPEIDSNELPPHVYLRSIHNISIERSWLRLRLDWGNNAVAVFNEGIRLGRYNPNNKDQ